MKERAKNRMKEREKDRTKERAKQGVSCFSFPIEKPLSHHSIEVSLITFQVTFYIATSNE